MPDEFCPIFIHLYSQYKSWLVFNITILNFLAESKNSLDFMLFQVHRIDRSNLFLYFTTSLAKSSKPRIFNE